MPVLHFFTPPSTSIIDDGKKPEIAIVSCKESLVLEIVNILSLSNCRLDFEKDFPTLIFETLSENTEQDLADIKKLLELLKAQELLSQEYGEDIVLGKVNAAEIIARQDWDIKIKPEDFHKSFILEKERFQHEEYLKDLKDFILAESPSSPFDVSRNLSLSFPLGMPWSERSGSLYNLDARSSDLGSFSGPPHADTDFELIGDLRKVLDQGTKQKLSPAI